MKVNLWFLCYALIVNTSVLNGQDYNQCTIGELDSLCEVFEERDRSIEGYKCALLYSEKTKGTSNHIQALFMLAIFQTGKLDYEQAEETCYKLLSLLGDDKSSLLHAKVCLLLGKIYYQTGKPKEAELQFLEVKALLKNYPYKDKDSYYDAYNEMLNNLGVVYYGYNKLEAAEQIMIEGLEVVRKKYGKENFKYINLLSNIAIVYEDLEEIAKAQKKIDEVLVLCKKVLGEEHIHYMHLLLEKARLYYRYGETKKAEPILFECFNALRDELGYKNRHTLLAILSLGTLNYYKGTPLEGLEYVKQCFAINAIQPVDTSRWDHLFEALGKVDFLSFDVLSRNFELTEYLFRKLYDQEKDKKWLEYLYLLYRSQNRVNKKVRNSFRTEVDKLKLTRKNAALAQKGVKIAVDLGTDDCIKNAFLFAEENKSVLLAQQLRNDEAKVFGNISVKLLEKEEKLQKKTSQIMGELAEISIQNSKRDSLVKALNETNQEIVTFQKALKKMYPKYHNRKYNEDQLSLYKLQRLLLADQALLEYLITESTIYIFVITQQSINVIPVSISKKELREKIKDLRGSLTNSDFIEENEAMDYRHYCRTAHWFYENLMEKALDSVLDKSINQLIIIPDGELGHLPFETFLSKLPDTTIFTPYNKLPYLLRTYEISYSYSATLWQENKENQQTNQVDRVLAYAPIYNNELNEEALLTKTSERLFEIRKGLLPLSENIIEVHNLSKLFEGKFRTGTAATEHQFKQDLSSYSIIHLATHGVLNKKHPILSSLVFTEIGDSLEDGFLQAYEISQMDMNAQLVVLSACETGFGKFEEGEGIMSIARSFMYAGTPSLVVSLWQVNDLSTSIIMQLFYEQLSKGHQKSKALQLTKLAYLKHTEGLAAHPIFWAPFIQLGNSESIFLYKKGKGSMQVLWIGFGILILTIIGIRIFIKSK